MFTICSLAIPVVQTSLVSERNQKFTECLLDSYKVCVNAWIFYWLMRINFADMWDFICTLVLVIKTSNRSTECLVDWWITPYMFSVNIVLEAWIVAVVVICDDCLKFCNLWIGYLETSFCPVSLLGDEHREKMTTQLCDGCYGPFYFFNVISLHFLVCCIVHISMLDLVIMIVLVELGR